VISFRQVTSTSDLVIAVFVVSEGKVEDVFNFAIVIKVNNVGIINGGWC